VAALLRHRLAVLILAIAAAAIAAVALSRAGTRPETGAPAAAAEPLQTAALATPLPSDPDVLTGAIENGFRFYIRRNTQPLGRAELRLVVNAGSVLERDDQRGLAHFVEHMAFNGTTHFPKQAIASFMQSIGMRFGPSVNATTGFDETVYSLQVPTDRADVVARSMQILEDWAHAVTFDPAEVDRERGVVIEEWRQRRGAAQRLQDAQSAVLFAGSPYADRAAIGTLESLQQITADRLREFYARWYRPDLMAIVAVGDVQPREIETLVRTHFAALRLPASPAPRPRIDVPPLPAPTFDVIADPEATGAMLSVYARFTPPRQATVGDYRREIVERLAAAMFAARLAESSHRPGAPLLNAGASRGRAVRAQDVVAFRGVLREDAIDKGVGAFLLELERIERFGFTAVELDRQKKTTLRGFERALAEKDTRPSATLAAEYIRNFTRDEPFPGLQYEFDLTERFLPEITLDDVNTVAVAWLPERRAVVLSAPEKPAVRLPDEAWLARAVAAADAATLAPYVAGPDSQPLLDENPSPGSIASTTVRGAVGVTEWLLSNGARVVLKPTTFKQDEVLFSALSQGGTSLAADADLVPAQTAAQVVASIGVGRFASAELRRALTGKVVSVRPVIGLSDEGLTGGASTRDLDALFQLIYLYFTQPRRDPALFGALTSQMQGAMAAQGTAPDFAFAAALTRALTGNHPRTRPLTPDMIPSMDLDRSLAFYRDRFADASDFTFFFVGSFDVDAIRPLVERYVASLPSLGRTEHWRDPGIRPPAGIVEERVERGTEPKSRTAIVFAGDYTPEPSRGQALRAAAEVLQTRLIAILREELGGTYTVTVNAAVARVPRPEYRVTVTFGSDPARADALAARVLDEAGRLAAGGATAAEVANVRTAITRELETSSRQNAFWMMQLAERYRLEEAPEALLEAPKIAAALDAASVHAAARAALDIKRYVKVTLLPAR
jgi:zinc protease